ncbi:MAG: hypothetical protein H7245_02485, partial [Candidatus Saccharibacteria bacterium]|nr:hypothetical protein [Pseudorhodobacter sp.]
MATPTRFGPTRFGTEFLVNTTTAGEQYEPAITALADGSFVVTWTDWSLSGGISLGEGVHAQVFNADGRPSGAEVPVNTITAGHQRKPAVA